MKSIDNAVEKHRRLILDAEKAIWRTPETGYREYKTSAYLAGKFEALGYKLTYADGIPGFYTVIDTNKPGPEILIFAELDSIICPEHSDADPETGAVHSCGHNAQCATLIGIAAALKEDGALDGLSGRIRLCAVPAEELLEIEYRTTLKRSGKIKYLGGKSEFLSRGYLDGVDMAFMVHTATAFSVVLGEVGCVTKNIIYKGRASHAGGAPWGGINALYAASCGINAVNAIRETFKDTDCVRVHPIITSGGAMVNAIPERAVLESYVRGKTYEVITETNTKVNRALIGAALSLGANIEIIDTPGYAPLVNDKGMISAARDAAELIIPDESFEFFDRYSTGSTDMGDISCIMPTVHLYARGSKGKPHGNDYEICDPDAACVKSAKWQLAIIRLLLENEAERAKKIIADFKPRFSSKQEFLEYQDSLNSSGDRIDYAEDGIAKIRL